MRLAWYRLRVRVADWIMPRVRSANVHTEVMAEACADLVRSSVAAIDLHDPVAARAFAERVATIAESTMNQVERDHLAGLHG